MTKGVDSTHERVCIIKCIITSRSGYEYKREFKDSSDAYLWGSGHTRDFKHSQQKRIFIMNVQEFR